ncbi:alpha/beta hydrolase [Pyruvatibacter mobilis]|jgi:pimeloyl-ACP methyl ester carboxylesterase|uniref:alpha/beta hydrolase n=1 Tax=Pyruvatibacter mobilis TaxID=1712261 RepID=UPI003C7B2DAF
MTDDQDQHMTSGQPSTLARPGGQTLAYHATPGKGPTVVWFGGFKSDMTGSKATAIEEWARARGRAYVRFDYFGHGASSGAFAEGTISRWLDDGMAVLDELAKGDVILVGSSMGGWLSLLAARTLAAREQSARLKGLVLIAPAPDFTERLMWAGFSDDIRTQIMETGRYLQPSDYDEPYEITRELIEDGRKHLIMQEVIPVTCPVRILQGMRDDDVPWQHALNIVEALEGNDVTYTLVKSGDHRLSELADIARLTRALDDITGA